jgi:hypothetical protein
MAWNLGVNGVIAQCAYKQGGHFVDHARLLRFVQGWIFGLLITEFTRYLPCNYRLNAFGLLGEP